MEKSYDMEREVKSAIVYPKVILGIATVMVMGMVLVIIPKLIKSIDNLVMSARGHHAAPLPLETQILITGAHVITPPGKIGSFEFFFLNTHSLNPGLLPRILLVVLLWLGFGRLRRL